jgi:hypothetical protein
MRLSPRSVLGRGEGTCITRSISGIHGQLSAETRAPTKQLRESNVALRNHSPPVRGLMNGAVGLKLKGVSRDMHRAWPEDRSSDHHTPRCWHAVCEGA